MTGEQLYAKDLKACPAYEDGLTRKIWSELPTWCQEWWDKMAAREGGSDDTANNA